MDVTGVNVQREIAKLDRQVAQAQERLDGLVKARQSLYQALIDQAAEALNDLRAKAGIPVPDRQHWRRPAAADGTVNGRALTDDQVRAAREQFAQRTASAGRLARQYGISSPAMSKLLRRETYKDVA